MKFTQTATTVTWSNPSGNCVFQEVGQSSTFTSAITPTAPNAAILVTCPVATTEQFTVARNGDATTLDTFNIAITDKGCYRWYSVLVSNNALSNAMTRGVNSTLRLWIISSSVASADELAGTAIVPSAVRFGNGRVLVQLLKRCKVWGKHQGFPLM